MHTNDQKITTNAGHGARGMGSDINTEAERLNRAATRKRKRAQAPSGADCTSVPFNSLDAVPALLGMAHCAAVAFARRWESAGGRPLTESDIDEARAIYHAEYAKAARISGHIAVTKEALARIRTEREETKALPVSGAAYASNAFRPYAVAINNPLPFRALLVWKRAIMMANKRTRSHIWGGGAEIVKMVSLSDLLSLKASLEGGEGRTIGDSISAESLASYCAPLGKAGKRRCVLRWRTLAKRSRSIG
jgi:hypothetical protein